MKFMFGLRHPLTCNPSTTLSNPCNKVRGEYFSKEVLRLPSFMRLNYGVVVMLNERVNNYITRGHASIEDYWDRAIKGPEECINNNKERVIMFFSK